MISENVMNKYKALLFDLDGTLLDTSEGIISSVKYAIECTGLEPLSDDKIKSFIGPPIQNTFRKFYNLNDEETSKISAIFRERYSTVDLLKAKLYDSVLETLEILKNEGYVIGIATYKREDYAKNIVEYFGISQFCDVIEGSDFAGKLTKADIINTVGEIDNKTEEYSKTKDENLFWQDVTDADEYRLQILSGYSRKLHKPLDQYLKDKELFNGEDTSNSANSDNDEEDLLSFVNSL